MKLSSAQRASLESLIAACASDEVITINEEYPERTIALLIEHLLTEIDDALLNPYLNEVRSRVATCTAKLSVCVQILHGLELPKLKLEDTNDE